MKKITALILVIALTALSLVSCAEEAYGSGSCEYTETRDAEGHDITFVEMCVKDYGKMVILLDALRHP